MKNDIWGLKLAKEQAKLGNCIRRQVGAVIFNENYEILSKGYNGVPDSIESCKDVYPCPNALNYVSGQGLDNCKAIHAEQIALIRCENINEAYYIYTTCSPCITCVKMLIHTPIINVIFEEEYAHNKEAKKLWLKTSTLFYHRKWIQLSDSN